MSESFQNTQSLDCMLLSFNFIKSIPHLLKYFDAENATVYGWGAIRYKGPSSDILLKVDVPVVSPDVCKKKYSDVEDSIITDDQLCYGYPKGGIN